MDSRVIELHEWILAQGEVNPSVVRENVIPLHAEIEDEESRVALIAIYSAITNSAMGALEAKGSDLRPLEDARQADMKMFCLVEATGPDGAADPVELDRVVSREIAAGRMEEGSFAAIARHGADVFGKPVRAKLGLFQKRFS